MKTIKDVLTEKGFKEGVDYTLSGNTLTPVTKTKIVKIPVHHEAIPEVKDEQGKVIVVGKDAWVDYIDTEKQYTEDLPSVEQLMRESVLSSDFNQLISMYVADKTKPVGDLNAELFVSGGAGWRITNIPAPTIEYLYANISVLEEKIAQGEIKKKADKDKRNTAKKMLQDYKKGTTKVTKIKDIDDLLIKILDLIDVETLEE